MTIEISFKNSSVFKKNIIFIYLYMWLCWVLVTACGIFSGSIWTLNYCILDLVYWSGMEPWPLHWELRVLATGLFSSSSSSLWFSLSIYKYICIHLIHYIYIYTHTHIHFMVGWFHKLKGHEFEQAPGDGEGQGSVACCSPCGHKKLDMMKWLDRYIIYVIYHISCIICVIYHIWAFGYMNFYRWQMFLKEQER